MRISSKKRGDQRLHVLVFDFAEMRAVLDAEKRAEPGSRKISLVELLSEHTFIKREVASYPADHHFTQVQLEEISDVHIRRLSDRAELRRYLLQALPIDFADEFEHKDAINQHLALSVPGYNPVTIQLQPDAIRDEQVQNPAIPRL